ncbi:MAG: hypothetical protein Q9166_006302 [cf. Caloplaca sp. 2 TL-2023]
MHQSFRGDCVYDSEVDAHFPELTVRQTLEFAAKARALRDHISEVGRGEWVHSITRAILDMFDLSHVAESKIGDDLTRGISGGERRRSFDKVTLLYEGRQIFFGRAEAAKRYFTDLGFDCLDGTTTADYLTSLTNPAERLVKEGFQHQVPQTPEDFEHVWRVSEDRKQLMQEIEDARRKLSSEVHGTLRSLTGRCVTIDLPKSPKETKSR